MDCPLCKSIDTQYFVNTTNRDYYKCANCEFIYVLPKFFLNNDEEKLRYNLHNNSIDNIGYRTFLSKAIPPIINRIPLGSKGLDFGSGPSPVLATLLEIEGYKMDFFDPYYVKNQAVFKNKYDFITLTEVAEHFYAPAIEFEKLISLLKPEAYLLIMTNRTDTITNFKSWYYQMDPTHVGFYADKSFKVLAEKYKMSIEIIDTKIVILNKQILYQR